MRCNAIFQFNLIECALDCKAGHAVPQGETFGYCCCRHLARVISDGSNKKVGHGQIRGSLICAYSLLIKSTHMFFYIVW